MSLELAEKLSDALIKIASLSPGDNALARSIAKNALRDALIGVDEEILRLETENRCLNYEKEQLEKYLCQKTM